MFEEVIACLDGSSLAETILPVARALSAPQGRKLTLLRIGGDLDELAAQESYLRERARQYGGQCRFLIGADPAEAIGLELERDPQAIAVLATHGRSAWTEAVVGSVALRVIRAARRPVILYHALGRNADAPNKISQIVVALDGSEFAAKIIPFAAKAAEALDAQLLLVQALAVGAATAALNEYERSDINEASYLRWQAADIKKKYAVGAQWEVLHGEPAAAICQYVKSMNETLLALTTHARGGIERAMFGSVAGQCVRHAGVPLLLYWPSH